jgi:glutamate N-acetyltransferase/amino-acid N-acetyltransferase
METIEGGITAPEGFLANGIACGIKKRKKDLALVVSERDCTFAGAFTTNLVKAAPVLWDRQLVAESPTVRGIVVNSGNANACTGDRGMADARAMAEMAASALGEGIDATQMLVCSTGIIGQPLPMETIAKGIARCACSMASGIDAARLASEAILTTDTFSKEIAVSVQVGDTTVRIGGMAKGSGMIHPNMATMLSFITTDVAISKADLQTLLGSSVVESYNMISVDGDTSTNDTVLVLANGMSGCDPIKPGAPGWDAFRQAFEYVHTYLAKAIVRDGEGAGKFIEVQVSGASDNGSARTLARSVVSSNLVKTAFFGSDANWGRILCAMGYAGAPFDPSAASIDFVSAKGRIPVFASGVPVAFDEKTAKTILLEKEVTVLVSAGDGPGVGTAWGCDLSYEYVHINGDYRS